MTGSASKMEILIAGHGGQGVLELGNYIAYRAMLSGKHVAYTPTYGPESRGGKVKCHVVISNSIIDSPIAEEPDYLIVMNLPSMEFQYLLKEGGILIMNSSLIAQEPARSDIRLLRIPATHIADELKHSLPEAVVGNIHDTRLVANCVMFGAYLFLTMQDFEDDLIKNVFRHFLTGKKSALIALNLAAVRKGYEYAKELSISLDKLA